MGQKNINGDLNVTGTVSAGGVVLKNVTQTLLGYTGTDSLNGWSNIAQPKVLGGQNGNPDLGDGIVLYYIFRLPDDFDFSQYNIYVAAINGTFIMTPFTTNETCRALCAANMIYNNAGETTLMRVRFITDINTIHYGSAGEKVLQIKFDKNLRDGFYGAVPAMYLFGIKF